jgi:hypothetical protein
MPQRRLHWIRGYRSGPPPPPRQRTGTRLNDKAAGLVTGVRMVDGVRITKFAAGPKIGGQQWRSGRYDRRPSRAGMPRDDR